MPFKIPFLFLLLTIIPACSLTGDSRLNGMVEESSNLEIIHYLALGDSYTVGESVPYEDSFPAQLSKEIETNLGYTVQTTVIAQTGWRTDQLISAVNGRSSAKNNLVTLLIGVNNQFQNKPFSQYETEFSTLLNKAVEFAGGDPNKVIVLSIPDYYFTPFGEKKSSRQISIELDNYNAYAQSVSKAKGVTFLNITDITRKGLDQPELVAKDGLHPSGIAYEKFVERLYPLVLSRLKN